MSETPAPTARPAQPIACARSAREPRDQVLAMWVMQTAAGPRLMLATDFETMSLSAANITTMLRTATAAGMMGGESECALVALEAILPFATLAPEWAIKEAQDAIRGAKGEA